MLDFSEVLETIKDFYQEKKVMTILTGVLIVLFFLGLIAFVVQSVNPDKNKPSETAAELPLVPDQKLLNPEGPSIPDGYALTRDPKEKWLQDEAEEFFTLPDTNELNKLESANDKIVQDILGATP